jgi:hypothetical protein
MKFLKFDSCGVWMEKVLSLVDKIGEPTPTLTLKAETRTRRARYTPELAARYTEMLQIQI